MDNSLILTTFAEYGGWAWLVAGAVLLILEVFVPGIFLIWFGLAAMVTGAVELYFPLPLIGQLGIFAASSIALLFAARSFFRYGVEVSDPENLNVRGHQYVGRVVLLEEAIENGRGRARIGDTLWAVEGEDAPKGARVRVKGARGTVLKVEAAGS